MSAERGGCTLGDKLLQQLHYGCAGQRPVDGSVGKQRTTGVIVDVQDEFFVRAAIVAYELAPGCVLLLAARRVRLKPDTKAEHERPARAVHMRRAHVKNGGHL